MIDDFQFLQTEASECGLASLAMSASMLGADIDLPSLRQKYAVSSRGLSLKELVDIAGSMGLGCRSVRCEVEELGELRTPAILHWGLNHYVVLCGVRRSGSVTIFDPAVGRLQITRTELSKRFTGIAAEISAMPNFRKKRERSPLQLFSLIQWSPNLRLALLQVLILSLILQIYILASPFYTQLAIDEAVLKGDVDLLTSLVVGFGAFAIFNAGADTLRAIVLQRVTSLLSWEMTHRLYHHLIRLPLAWFQRRRLADVLTRFQSLDPVKALIVNGLIGGLVDGVMAVTTLAMMVVYSPALTLVALSSVTIYVALRLIGVPIMLRFAGKALVASIAENSKRIETLRAIQTIKAMDGESLRENDWVNRLADSIRANQTSAFAGLTFSGLHKLFDSLAMILIVFLCARDIIEGHMTVGVFYAFIAYQTQFLARSYSFFEQIVSWRMLDLYLFRLADIVITPVEPGIEKSAVGLPSVSGKIELDKVGFRYSAQDPQVLSDISLSIEPGEFVAIVGRSGAGKSTLLKIIGALYPPSAGEVRLDGVPYAFLGPRAVRRAIGVVLQDDELLSGSIARNVAFFDEQIDIERVWRCLRLAAIDEEIQQMPMRAETMIGDMGSTLSGGQKQRLFLARALYRQPKILVLDEATSHLDQQCENTINETLRGLSVTRIIAAHRPETIAAADRVLRLDSSRLTSP
jgi:ATP-binding cassette subfamily B protein RaxB